ncbi:MAG TPA: hypothetical protein DEB74_07430 [Lachnospiraceae bacterium]|nr:hypothetical protein [Lachnospiraceae bacterium]
MCNFFRYECNNHWITVRNEEDSYYVVNPNNVLIIKLNKIQAAMLYFLCVNNKSTDELKRKFSNNGVLEDSVDQFIRNAKDNDLL